MELEEAKNFLAANDDKLSYMELSRITGYPINELRDLYDDIVDNHELRQRKRNYNKFRKLYGAYRISPITFEAKKYNTTAEIKNDGYVVSNVLNACNNPHCLCRGYLWRYALYIDPEHIEDSVKGANPEMFVSIKATDVKTGEVTEFETLQHAVAMGWKWAEIVKCLNGEHKTFKGKKWEVT